MTRVRSRARWEGHSSGEIGCQFVEVGHAERRQLLGEIGRHGGPKCGRRRPQQNDAGPLRRRADGLFGVEQAGAWCISQLEWATGP